MSSETIASASLWRDFFCVSRDKSSRRFSASRVVVVEGAEMTAAMVIVLLWVERGAWSAVKNAVEDSGRSTYSSIVGILSSFRSFLCRVGQTSIFKFDADFGEREVHDCYGSRITNINNAITDTMVLSINAATSDATQCDESASPLKRKSELISPSCLAAAAPAALPAGASNEGRCPLSEINTISKHDATNATKDMANNKAVVSSARYSYSSTQKMQSETTSKTPTTNTNRTGITHSGIKYNKFKSQHRPSKDEIEATNEKQASVNQLSEWLANEATKKNKKFAIIDRPPLSASDINLLRFQNKPRIKKSDVEATDNKRVSVKTISSWMSDDPFEQKKVRTIRTGHKIIAKSRAFEKEPALLAGRQCDIKAGSVEEKSAWLSRAFKHEGNAGDSSKSSSFTVEKNVIRPYQAKPAKMVEGENELKSVNEKKEWLSNAFTKKGGDSFSTMIRQEKSNEWHPIQQARSYEVNHQDDTTFGIFKSESADNSHHVPTLYHTKSYDHGEESFLENELKGVKDKKEWLSNAFAKKESEKCAIAVHHSHPEHERTSQTNSIELNNEFNMPNILKSKSADTSHHESVEGPTRSRPSVTTAPTFEKKRGEVVGLYQQDSNNLKTSPKDTLLKTVKDKQAWLSSAFKTPANSAPVIMIGGVTKQQQTKVAIQGAAVVAADKNIVGGCAANPSAMERLSTTVSNEMPHEENDTEEDLEKMSVADRAKWLKMAFKK